MKFIKKYGIIFFLHKISNLTLPNDMQKKCPPPLRNGHICMKDSRCAETNEKQFSDPYSLSYG